MAFQTIDSQGRQRWSGAPGPAGPAGSVTGTGTYAARPAAGTAGNLYLPSDGLSMTRDSGSAWVPWGPLFPLTAPPTGSWSWVNQGSSTITETKDALILLGAASGNTANLVARVLGSYPTTPFTITAYVVAAPIFKNNHGWGLILRQSGAGTGQNRVRTFGLAQFAASATIPGQALQVWGAASVTTGYSDFPFAQPVLEAARWFRLSDNGTNLTYSTSGDGQNWMQLFTESRTAYLLQGPDQIGFFAATQNTATPNLDVPVTVLSWLQT